MTSAKGIRSVIAKNITDLRLAKGMTQLELANLLSYSDKAVSKWERGESLPDVEVLYRIARLFDVSLDYLVTAEHETPAQRHKAWNKLKARNHGVIIGMSVFLVWFIACLLFVIFDSIWPGDPKDCLPFLYAVPLSFIVWLILNSVWFSGRKNTIIVSLLMWSVLGCLFLTFRAFTCRSLPFLFLLGVPGQIIIFLWSKLKSGDGHYINANIYEDDH